MTSAEQPADPFADLDAFADQPRVAGHWLSPDGSRLVVGVGTRDKSNDRFVNALWEVDPAGGRPARRLTRSAQGESGAAFTPNGDLLFVSTRPDPVDEDGDPVPALWLQPAGGGDAKVVANPPGGVRGVVVGADGTVVVGAAMLPSATDLDSEREIRGRRQDAKVTAILHEDHPVRFWNRDIGPDGTRLLVGRITDDLAADDTVLALTDVTGHVGWILEDDATWDVSPDGRTVVSTWAAPKAFGERGRAIVAIDVATHEWRVLAEDDDHDFEAPRISPDGTQVVCVVERQATFDEPVDLWLAVVPIGGGDVRYVAQDWDRWPHRPVWTPDGTAVVVAADDNGRSPLWRVDVATGDVTRLTTDHGAYTEFAVTPDGRWVHAQRTAIDGPPTAVRVAMDGSGAMTTLRGPVEPPALPGTLTEVTATGEDGTPVRAWLALPHGASEQSPAPLLLKVHGGPMMSAHNWSWRSCPWVYVARGYAVLMPDPALSSGYGLDFVRRGWSGWGGTPYTDLMRITDVTEQRPDIDETRAGAMGGSFGGYMANWIAGHTDRFAAIMTHASLWDLNRAVDTGDLPSWFRKEMSYETADANSPYRFADAITTPMLITHGDKDYRVPIGEAMKMWWDLSARAKGVGTSPHKFLYFPTENHFLMSPNHQRVWYETIAAFFDHHVLGQPWRRPDLLA